MFYELGKRAALERLVLTPSTGDSGKLRETLEQDPKDQANTAFKNHDNAKTRGFEKEAVVGHGLLAGLLGHIGVNTLGRAAHHGSNIASVLAHKGLQHGYLESAVNPFAMRTIKALAGPEAVVPYQAAQRLGSKLKDIPPEYRETFIKNLLENSSPSSTPVLGPVREALQHHIADTAPTLTSKGLGAKAFSGAVDKMTNIVNKPFDTKLQKTVKSVAGGTPAAGLLAADPLGGAAHIGVNSARETLGKSMIGKAVIKRNLAKGLAGDTINPIVEKATDYLVSPGFLDPYRVGKSVYEASENASPLVQRGISELGKRL